MANIALYNAEKQELIGIFSTNVLAARYLFPFGKQTQRGGGYITVALKRRGAVLSTDICKRVAVRPANEKQKEMLAGNDYVIINGYRPFIDHSDKAFSSNKESLNIGAAERNKRRWAEIKQKKQNG